MSDRSDTTKKILYGPSAEEMARYFHETYERLAPMFSYETREASAKPWEEVPNNNKELMIATCAQVIKWLRTGRQ